MGNLILLLLNGRDFIAPQTLREEAGLVQENCVRGKGGGKGGKKGSGKVSGSKSGGGGGGATDLRRAEGAAGAGTAGNRGRAGGQVSSWLRRLVGNRES